MKVFDLRADLSAQSEGILDRRYLPDPKITSQVATILAEGRQRQDDALIEFAERFDRAALQPAELAVTKEEIERAMTKVNSVFVEALRAAHTNIRDFASAGRRTDWKASNAQGAIVG